jgi:hypothetical protein
MRVTEAKSIAREFVIDKASMLRGLHGAYFAGSANWLADDAELPPTSDLDVNLVFSSDGATRQGKLVHRGVLLDVTPLSFDQLRSPEQVLRHYHLAGGFRTPSIILDPSGRLTALQAAVAREFARRAWIRLRCEHARSRILEQLDGLNAAQPFHDQVIGWIFPTGVTTHVLLSAGLRNPTVRRRYVAARELLAKYGYLDFYEELLELLGCARIHRTRVEHYLAALTDAFDSAKVVIRTPFGFASDISDAARPIAIDGSRELIERGLHREAMFWIVVSFSRCQKVLAADAPVSIAHQFDAPYRELLGDIGIASFADIQHRTEHVKMLLPRVWDMAEAVMAANPQVEN